VVVALDIIVWVHKTLLVNEKWPPPSPWASFEVVGIQSFWASKGRWCTNILHSRRHCLVLQPLPTSCCGLAHTSKRISSHHKTCGIDAGCEGASLMLPHVFEWRTPVHDHSRTRVLAATLLDRNETPTATQHQNLTAQATIGLSTTQGVNPVVFLCWLRSQRSCPRLALAAFFRRPRSGHAEARNGAPTPI